MTAELRYLFVSLPTPWAAEGPDILMHETPMPCETIFKRELGGTERATEGPMIHVDWLHVFPKITLFSEAGRAYLTFEGSLLFMYYKYEIYAEVMLVRRCWYLLKFQSGVRTCGDMLAQIGRLTERVATGRAGIAFRTTWACSRRWRGAQGEMRRRKRRWNSTTGRTWRHV